MIYLVKVHYEDNVGKITGYRQLDDNEIWDETRFKQVNKPLYDFIAEKYADGELTFDDSIEVLTVDNVQFTPFDKVAALVNNALQLYIFRELRHEDATFDMFLISIKFTMLNNQFLAAGFYFTLDNKEEIYLNVLNSGDEHLIGLLEDYIETLEAVGVYSTKVNNYVSMRKELEDAASVQEVMDIYASYTARNLIDDMNT